MITVLKYAKKCKDFLMEHCNCIPWFICGLFKLVVGNISRFEYFVCWIALLILIVMYVPADPFKYGRRKNGKD